MRTFFVICGIAVAAFALGVVLGATPADCPAHVTALLVRA